MSGLLARDRAEMATSAPELFLLDLPVPGPARRVRQARTALGFVIAAVLLTGVGAVVAKQPQSSTSPSARALVLGAHERSAAGGSAHMTADVKINIDGQSLSGMSAEGDTDPRTEQATMTMTIGGLSLEIRSLGGIVYMRSDAFTLPKGKSWVKVDPAALGDLEAPVQPPTNPTNDLEMLGALSGDPVVIGHESVDGVPVTHYGVTLDLGDLFARTAEGSAALGSDDIVNTLKSLDGKVDLHHVDGEVWLDDSGRAREFLVHLKLSIEGSTLDEVIDMHFSDFGAPVTVEAPAAAEVVPFSAVPNLFKGKLVES